MFFLIITQLSKIVAKKDVYNQGHLVFNKLSEFLNFQIFFFKSGAVPNRTYRAWVSKIGRKNRVLNSPVSIIRISAAARRER